MTNSVRILLIGALAAAAASCGDAVRSSRSPVALSVSVSVPSSPLLTFVSHVTTPVTPDFGQVTFNASMRDVTVTPTANNQMTITRYHVEYTRADGHNQAGVDVPFPFDGAFTLTIVPGTPGISQFLLVRTDAK